MTSLTEQTKILVADTWHRFQKAGFWWLIIFMLGAAIGIKLAEHIYSTKFDDAIKLGGVIHKTIVYDIRLRP